MNILNLYTIHYQKNIDFIYMLDFIIDLDDLDYRKKSHADLVLSVNKKSLYDCIQNDKVKYEIRNRNKI